MNSLNIVIEHYSTIEAAKTGDKPSVVLGGEIKLSDGGEIIGANLLPYGSQDRIMNYDANGIIDLVNGKIDFTVYYNQGTGEFVAPRSPSTNAYIPTPVIHTTLHSYRDSNNRIAMLALPQRYYGDILALKPASGTDPKREVFASSCYCGTVERMSSDNIVCIARVDLSLVNL